MWSVVDAKSQLSEILRRVRSGTPQFIGTQDSCVVISSELYQAKIIDQEHDGEWLIKQTTNLGVDLQIPGRGKDRDDTRFED